MTARALRPFVLTILVLAALVALPVRSASAADDDEAAAPAEAGDDAEPAAADGEGDAADPGDDAAEPGEKKAKADSEASAEDDASLGHAGQFGLRFGVVGGLAMIVRYEKSTYCREPDDSTSLQNEPKFCGHVAPFAFDFGLSFGVGNVLEPFVWARLGLSGEEQTDTNPLVVIGAGVRVYTMSDAAFKIFVEPAVALEFEDGQGHEPWSLVPDGYGTDLVFHLAAGPQIDVSRNIGIYFTGGITTGVLRSIHTTLDLQVGLQGRYP